MVTLEELFEEAMKYGRLNVHQCKNDRTFSVTIYFNTIQHVELEAHSGFRNKTIKAALIKAIENAVLIVESMKKGTSVDTAQTLKLLGKTK